MGGRNVDNLRLTGCVIELFTYFRFLLEMGGEVYYNH